jgi:hypothetical protein
VDEIAPLAFMWCQNLMRVVIPRGVRYIHESAFYGGKLQVIDADENNSTYATPGGVLYDKAMTTLLAYPSCRIQSAHIYKIPYGIRRIGDYAIACKAHLTDLIIPETVVSIGEWVGKGTLFQVHCADDSYALEFFGENISDEDYNSIPRYNNLIAARNEEEEEDVLCLW